MGPNSTARSLATRPGRRLGYDIMEVYTSLTIEHLKRVLSERCLPDNIMEKIWFKRTMDEIWKFLASPS
jgi:hypothetical protein